MRTSKAFTETGFPRKGLVLLAGATAPTGWAWAWAGWCTAVLTCACACGGTGLGTAQSALKGSVAEVPWWPLAFMLATPMYDSAEPSEYALEWLPNIPALLGEGTGEAGTAGTGAAGFTTVAIFPSHCSGRGRSLGGTGTTVGAAGAAGAGDSDGAGGAGEVLGAGEGAPSDRGHRVVLVHARGSFVSMEAAFTGPVHKPLAELRLLLLLLLLFFDAILSSCNRQ